MNKELANNTTLSHYRTVSKISADEVGEVCRAHDSRLGREVAIKVLDWIFQTMKAGSADLSRSQSHFCAQPSKHS